ncbi:hypothetical protein Tco_0307296 [Tanacetum coccineum]
MAWNVIACLHGMNVIACLHDMVDKLAFMAWLLACLRGMDGKEARMMMMMMINKLSLELSVELKKNEELVGLTSQVLLMKKLAFMAWNVIACLHGMNVIACLHDMVDKLAFMAWLLACLRGMDGKVSEIGSKARNDEIKNVKFIDTGSMKEKMKM